MSAKHVAVFFALSLGCGFDSSGSGASAASLGGSESDDGQSEDTDPDMPSSSASETGAADASGGTSTNGNDADTGGVDSTSTSGGDETVGSASDTGEDTDAVRPKEEYLSNTDQDTCTQPLWCFSGAITNPTGTAFDAQGCFAATLEPPFEITQVHYTVADAGATPLGMVLEIRGTDASWPGDVVQSWDLPLELSSPGAHVFTLPQPLEWTSPRLCVGVSVPSGTSDQAVGMAIDTTGTVEQRSWLRMFGGGACSIPSWADTATSGFTPSGNWCIGTTIREIL
jgi:hypothetical protein